MRTLNEFGDKVSNVASVGQAKRIYDKEGLFPSLNVGWSPLVLKDILEDTVEDKYLLSIKNATKQGYLEAKQGDGISLEHPNSTTRRGRVQEQMSPTLQCNDSKGVVIKEYNNFFILPRKKDNKLINGAYNRVWHKNYCGAVNTLNSFNILDNKLRIRKLTPKECFRLQGFLKDQIKVEGISNSQQYKLAGNGWEINLVSKIMRGFL